jgi:hypothetical protein
MQAWICTPSSVGSDRVSKPGNSGVAVIINQR